MRRSSILVCVVLISSTVTPWVQAQGDVPIELQPIGAYIKTQLGMVAMPPTWQSNVLPGTVIFVDRRQTIPHACDHVSVGCVYKDKYIIPTPDSVSKDEVNRPGAMEVGALNSMGSHDVGVSVLVGRFAPSLAIGTQSHIDYTQSHFTTIGWGPKILTSAKVLKDSTDLKDDLTLGVVDGVDRHHQRAWKYFGRGYLVTSVAYATDLDVAVDQHIAVSGSLTTLQEGKCTNAKLVSLLKGDTTGTGTTAPPATPPANPAPTALPSTSPNAAKTAIDTAKSTDTGTKTQIVGAAKTPDVTVSVCLKKQGVYTLHVSPGIPIAFSAVPIFFDPQTNLPVVQMGDLEILQRSLKTSS